jgi:lipoic acid synthetase
MDLEALFDASPRLKRRAPALPENPESNSPGRFPSWLHRKLPTSVAFNTTSALLNEAHLPTVCEEAKCPNRFECYSKKTATFLVCGSSCTRACGFCDIDHAKSPPPLAADEPERLANTAAALGLRHVVITMVARDDLADGGAYHLVKIIRAVRECSPGTTLELLTSDLAGKSSSLDKVLDEEPEIFNHNIETIRRLTPRIRHTATYERTLSVLAQASESKKTDWIKSGLMVGLGEEPEEVMETLRDLKAVGVDIVTIGQYLQPSRKKLRVKSFVTPEQFEAYAQYGRSIGIHHMYCGPFVRSSYNADAVYDQIKRGSKLPQ